MLTESAAGGDVPGWRYTPLQIAARATALTALLSACVPSIVVGDSPQDSEDNATTTTAPEPTTDPTDTDAPTTGEPLPGVCGDGVVNEGEACDDGDDEPNDGCDASCARTGEVVWTVEKAGDINTLAVGPDGTIYLTGFDPVGFLAAYAPDGSELWRVDSKAPGRLAVDAGGTIFALSFNRLVAHAPDSTELWEVQPHGPNEPFAEVGMGVGGDALYIGTGRTEMQEGMASTRVAVQRRDLATGELVWESSTPEEENITSMRLAVAGDRVFVVGSSFHQELGGRGMLAEFDPVSGELRSFEFDDASERRWLGLAALGDGDLVLLGRNTQINTFVVRRLGPDLGERWTDVTGAGVPGITPELIAVGPGERIAVIGTDNTDFGALLRLYDGSGATLWASTFASPPENERSFIAGVGFGAGLLFAASEVATTDEDSHVTSRWWLRGFALD